MGFLIAAAALAWGCYQLAGAWVRLRRGECFYSCRCCPARRACRRQK